MHALCGASMWICHDGPPSCGFWSIGLERLLVRIAECIGIYRATRAVNESVMPKAEIVSNFMRERFLAGSRGYRECLAALGSQRFGYQSGSASGRPDGRIGEQMHQVCRMLVA